MVLDECLAYPASHEAARVATQRTVRWAGSGYAHFREHSGGGQRACFLILHGPMFAGL